MRFGRASNGAAIVAMGADCRRIAPDARFLLHRTRASADGASVKALQSLIADLETVDRLAVSIFAAATGQPAQQVATWEREAVTFDAREAINIGLAHELRQSAPVTAAN